MAAYLPPEEDHMLVQFEDELIDWVQNVDPLLDELLRDKPLLTNQYRIISACKSNKEKMAELFKAAKSWTNDQMDRLYQALKTTNPTTMEKVENISYKNISAELAYYCKQLKEEVKDHFEVMKDRNSLMGENSLLRKRYTPLVMLRRFRNEEERREEICASGKDQEKIMMERSNDSSATTMEKLFDPDKDGSVPKMVVLQGPNGIGKSMTAHKISLDWANGSFYPDRFQFLFYLSYKDFNNLQQNMSLAAYLVRVCHWNCQPGTMKQILSRSENVLFIINAYDAYRWPAKAEGELCDDPFKVVHKDVLLRSLLRRHLAPNASFVITTRPYALDKMKKLLVDSPRFVDILGYTAESRERYIRVYFNGKSTTERAVEVIKNNPILFTMCHVPFMCWVVSTVTQQEVSKYPLRNKGDSAMFLYYLKGVLKYHNRRLPEDGSLKKLCALANEALLEGKVFFQEEDLKRHNISMGLVESSFLNENTFHGDIGHRTYYSFIHHSFQEFLAVVYYAVPPRGQTSQKILHHFLPEVCKGRSLGDLLQKHPNLALAVKFLFGLSNQKLNSDFTNFVGSALSFQASPAMGDWLVGEESCDFGTVVMRYVHETQNEDFAQKLMSRFPELRFSQSQDDENWISHLAFCLKAGEGKKVTLSGYTLGSRELNILFPLLHKCQQLSFRSCCFVQDDSVQPANEKPAPQKTSKGSSRSSDRGPSRSSERGSSRSSDRGFSRSSDWGSSRSLDWVFSRFSDRSHPRSSDRSLPRTADMVYLMESHRISTLELDLPPPSSSEQADSQSAEWGITPQRAYAIASEQANRRSEDWPYTKKDYFTVQEYCGPGELFRWVLNCKSDIREMCLWGCNLPKNSLSFLSAALDTNETLTTLNIMFKVDKKKEREEMARCQDIFKAHDCNMSTRKMLGKIWCMLQLKRKVVKYRRVERLSPNFPPDFW